MSAESITAFRQKLAGNSTLQMQVIEAMKTGVDAVVALGRAEGFDFGASDIEVAVSGSDLSDFELSLISAGRISAAGDMTHSTP